MKRPYKIYGDLLEELSTTYYNPYTAPYAIQEFIQKHSPARKTLQFEPIPSGAIARFDIGGSHPVIWLDKKRDIYGGVEVCEFSQKWAPAEGTPEWTEDSNLIITPTHEYAHKVKLHKDGILGSKVYNVAKQFVKYESDVLVGMLDLAVEQEVTDVENWTSAGINQLFRMVEQHDLCTSVLIMHNRTLQDLYKNEEIAKLLDHDEDGSHLWTAKIIAVDSPKTENRIFCMSGDQYVGALCERHEVWGEFLNNRFTENDEGSIYNDTGFVICNSYAVSMLTKYQEVPDNSIAINA